jgi:hypothetical protein
MPRITTKSGTLTWQYEDDAGASPIGEPCTLTFEIEYWFYPGEPMIWRDRNGDGNPGCPDEIELERFALVTIGKLRVKEVGDSVAEWFERHVDANKIERERIDAAILEKITEAAEPQEIERD